NEAFDEMLERFSDHPAARYVQFVKGVNLTRSFKTITQDSNLQVRDADLGNAERHIAAATAYESPIDTISKGQALDKLAAAQRTKGDEEGARRSRDLANSLMPPRKRTARVA